MRPQAPSFFSAVPVHSSFCACDLCDTQPDLGAPTDPAPACVERDGSTQCDCGACLFARKPVTHFALTPLARAALENGVSFADVQAYVGRLPERIPLLPEDYDSADALLDLALAKSVDARGVARSRVWWAGVLL